MGNKLLQRVTIKLAYGEMETNVPLLPHRAGFKSGNKSELLGVSDEHINLDEPFLWMRDLPLEKWMEMNETMSNLFRFASSIQ